MQELYSQTMSKKCTLTLKMCNVWVDNSHWELRYNLLNSPTSKTKIDTPPILNMHKIYNLRFEPLLACNSSYFDKDSPCYIEVSNTHIHVPIASSLISFNVIKNMSSSSSPIKLCLPQVPEQEQESESESHLNLNSCSFSYKNEDVHEQKHKIIEATNMDCSFGHQSKPISKKEKNSTISFFSDVLFHLFEQSATCSPILAQGYLYKAYVSKSTKFIEKWVQLTKTEIITYGSKTKSYIKESTPATAIGLAHVEKVCSLAPLEISYSYKQKVVYPLEISIKVTPSDFTHNEQNISLILAADNKEQSLLWMAFIKWSMLRGKYNILE
jgi:hypothetical protein